MEGIAPMLDSIVRYLHDALIPFRLASYPSPERLPKAGGPLPTDAIRVTSQVLLVGDKLTIAVWPENEQLDTTALANELNAAVIEPLREDLPQVLQDRDGPPPPLGRLLGMPVVVDEEVERWALLVFEPFGESDYVEIAYDDFARQEAPKVLSFSRAGELPPASREEAAAAPH